MGHGKTRNALFGVDRFKNFCVSSVLDLFGGGDKVLRILTVICAAAGVQIKIALFSSCSLRAARTQRSGCDVFCSCILTLVYVYTYHIYI